MVQDLGGIELHRQGRNWLGLCPFHQENTPSFTVTPEKQMFYCFGCGAGGDGIAFVARLRGLSNLQAAKMICSAFGLPIDDHEDATEAAHLRQEAKARRRRLEFLNAAWNLAWAAASAYYRAAVRANEVTNYTDPVLMQAELEADALLGALEDPDPTVRLRAIKEAVGLDV